MGTPTDLPILYIDVDGVLFGYYGGHTKMQLRPGVNAFLTFCVQNFNCRWLTSWTPEQLDSLLTSTCAGVLRYAIEYRDWGDFKSDAIDPQEPWIWLDDQPAQEDLDRLAQWDQVDQLVRVSPNGVFELIRVQRLLTLFLQLWNEERALRRPA